jgi:amino acid transporter
MPSPGSRDQDGDAAFALLLAAVLTGCGAVVMLAGTAASGLVLGHLSAALPAGAGAAAALAGCADRRVAAGTTQRRRRTEPLTAGQHHPRPHRPPGAPGAARRRDTSTNPNREVTPMPRSRMQDPDTYGTAELVVDAGFVVAAFIALIGVVVFVVATLTTIVLTATGALSPEAPIVAALGALTAGFFGAMAVAWADAGATALPSAIAPHGLRGPEDTAGPLRAMR